MELLLPCHLLLAGLCLLWFRQATNPRSLMYPSAHRALLQRTQSDPSLSLPPKCPTGTTAEVSHGCPCAPCHLHSLCFTRDDHFKMYLSLVTALFKSLPWHPNRTWNKAPQPHHGLQKGPAWPPPRAHAIQHTNLAVPPTSLLCQPLPGRLSYQILAGLFPSHPQISAQMLPAPKSLLAILLSNTQSLLS
jgi:hypothetical protein